MTTYPLHGCFVTVAYRTRPIRYIYRCSVFASSESPYTSIKEIHNCTKPAKEEKEFSVGGSNSQGMPCSVCGKKFRKNNSLTVHMRIHTGERHFTCDFCDMSFTQTGNWARHRRTVHVEGAHFDCNYCSQTFNQIFNLNRHLKIHTGEKPNTCDMCSRSFGRKEHLK